MTEYASTTISDTQARKNMTTMGKVVASDLMMIIRWVIDIVIVYFRMDSYSKLNV